MSGISVANQSSLCVDWKPNSSELTDFIDSHLVPPSLHVWLGDMAAYGSAPVWGEMRMI